MTSIYDATSTRALATITDKGAAAVFLADAWHGGTIASDVTSRAVELPGDPDTFAALNLVLVNPVTLLIAAKNLAITPAPGMQFTWAGTTYTVKNARSVAPDGTPIIWTVIGDA